MRKGKLPQRNTVIAAAFVLTISVLIKVASLYPFWIEKNYSRGVYPCIAKFFRTVFGWIPFSVGDVLYAAAGVYVLSRLIRIVNIFAGGRIGSVHFKKKLVRAFFILSAIYVYFNVSWGLNYNRPGISFQLGLNPKSHNKADLEMIAALLIKKVNETRLLLGPQKILLKSYTAVFRQAEGGYLAASAVFPFLRYNTISVKRSMYGRMGNFLGFLGYYNPFTGEAQVNLTQPRFLIPFVSCHEMAHQLGYASESEANFVGYLAAINAPDTLFHYSAYFDLFNYANRELFLRDSVAARRSYNKLDTLVKIDQQELREYWSKSDNAIEPVIKLFYDRYLKANQQAKGVESYNEVIGWLIAYYKKYGKI